MNAYANLVKEAWRAYKSPGEYLREPFPLGTRFAFRRDEHRSLRACFIEYNETGYVRMIFSYPVHEEE